MQLQPRMAAVAFDLTRLHRRTVTSFYSNLVTRPTGRAIRLGVEQQLVEVAAGAPCLSILDFSHVRVMDYSCADEIVAKLLMRYAESDRPVNAYFLARGLQNHHLEAVDAVLERHDLLLVSEAEGGEVQLLGPCTGAERTCWSCLVRRGRARLQELALASGMRQEALFPTVRRFVAARVAVEIPADLICPLSELSRG
jgi:hypothetical protein